MTKRVTQHEFIIKPDTSENYFSLLSKYYEEIKVTAIFEDMSGNKSVMQGKTSKDWFADLATTRTKYHLLTDFFPVYYATIRTLPPIDYYFFGHTKLPKIEKKLRKIRSVISEVIAARILNKDEYIYRKFPFTSNVSFGELLHALHCLKKIDSITRCLIDYRFQKIILVLNDVYPIGLTTTFISDAILPSFDVEEGFAFDILSSQWATKEWARYFRDWKSQLDVDYSLWNEPIFPPDYTWSLLIT